MSELEKRENSSRYDCMTTEELQEILRKHANNELETEPDTQELFIIMEVLSIRRKNTDPSAFRSDEEAFAEFCEHYMPKEKDTVRSKVIRFPNRIFNAVAAVLAIVLVLAVGTTLTAKAFHIDIWSKFASWTSEFFQFAENPQEITAEKPEVENNLELRSLQDALVQHNISEEIATSWLPEGYIHKDVRITATPKVVMIHAQYIKGETELIINIRQTIGAPANQVEKSDNLFEIYTKDGVEYYIFSNNTTLQTKWSIGEFECTIIGQITIDEMKAMIDSI